MSDGEKKLEGLLDALLSAARIVGARKPSAPFDDRAEAEDQQEEDAWNDVVEYVSGIERELAEAREQIAATWHELTWARNEGDNPANIVEVARVVRSFAEQFDEVLRFINPVIGVGEEPLKCIKRLVKDSLETQSVREQIAALQADKERLDFIEAQIVEGGKCNGYGIDFFCAKANDGFAFRSYMANTEGKSIREAIDAARGEQDTTKQGATE